jgi:outer membrane usher protein FimD/PapC
MDDQRIIVELDSVLQGYGNGTRGVTQPGTIPSAAGRTLNQSGSNANAFMSGISAQLMLSGFSRMLSATGNQELAGGIREGAEWMFLGSRALTGDPTAIATAAFKLSSEGIKLIKKYIDKQKEIASKYNEKDYILMRYGIISINANTEISYKKFGRLNISDRK